MPERGVAPGGESHGRSPRSLWVAIAVTASGLGVSFPVAVVAQDWSPPQNGWHTPVVKSVPTADPLRSHHCSGKPLQPRYFSERQVVQGIGRFKRCTNTRHDLLTGLDFKRRGDPSDSWNRCCGARAKAAETDNWKWPSSPFSACGGANYTYRTWVAVDRRLAKTGPTLSVYC